VTAAFALGAPAAWSAGSAGCEATNRGALSISVGPGAASTRETPLAQGETLTLSVASQGRASVRLTGGNGAPRTLVSGNGTTSVFVAPADGTYGFRLEADSAGATLTARCTSVAEANTARALLDRRNAFLTAREPDRISIDRQPKASKPIDGTVGDDVKKGSTPTNVVVSVSTSELADAMKAGTRTKEPGLVDFWFEGRYQTYEYYENLRPNDGNFSVVYLGSKSMLGPDIMFGALAQFDQTGETAAATGSVSTSGWMAGPYMSVRFGPGVVFDGRAAWGVAERPPSGILIDRTPAERRLVRGTLRGSRQIGDWTLAPSVGLSYVQDAAAFEDADVSDALSQPSGTGRLNVLPELKRRFNLEGDTYVEPRFAAGGFLSFDNLSAAAPINLSTASDLHWKAEAGVAVGKKDSLNLEASGGVETTSEAAPDTWSGRLQLNMPLGK
jgi:hypothetical protein